MSSSDVSSRDASQLGSAWTVDANLEVIVIPVSDVDRAKAFYLAVADIEAARDDLLARGIEVSDVFHEGAPGARFHPEGNTRLIGLAPDRGTYTSFASFSDPDGNAWLFQEVTSRLPGRINPAATTFASAGDLASALRRVEAAHGEHEKRTGKPDANWPDWYAAYMVAEQAGANLPV